VRVDISGGFNGPTYTNNALGFTVTLPLGWQVQDREVHEQFAESATKKTEEITEGKPGAQASVERTKLLFIALKPTDGLTNPSVVAMTEDLTLVFNIRTPRQYLESMRQVAANSPLVFDDQITTEKINGVEFGVSGAAPRDTMSAPSPGIRQRYYVILQKNRALGFILTYDGNEQLRACMDMLNSFKLL
jgi:hypothetical protein